MEPLLTESRLSREDRPLSSSEFFACGAVDEKRAVGKLRATDNGIGTLLAENQFPGNHDYIHSESRLSKLNAVKLD